jgi:hypothetical protein
MNRDSCHFRLHQCGIGFRVGRQDVGWFFLLPSLWEGLGEGLATTKEKRKVLRAGFQPARIIPFGYRPQALPTPSQEGNLKYPTAHSLFAKLVSRRSSP